MLQRDDLDAVIIATPMQIHAAMSIDAMQAGKHVLSEVAAAMTIDECWGLIHAAEKTGKIYMLSENCCYYESVMAILNMVQKGIFGELTYAECGYVHDCSSLMFEGSGALTWRARWPATTAAISTLPTLSDRWPGGWESIRAIVWFHWLRHRLANPVFVIMCPNDSRKGTPPGRSNSRRPTPRAC